MDVENVVLGLIAGLVIALFGFAFRPRRGGQRVTGDERIEALGWVLVGSFFIFVLQLAGVGNEFALATIAAGVVLLLYLLVRRPTRRLDVQRSSTIAPTDRDRSPRRRAG